MSAWEKTIPISLKAGRGVKLDVHKKDEKVIARVSSDDNAIDDDAIWRIDFKGSRCRYQGTDAMGDYIVLATIRIEPELVIPKNVAKVKIELEVSLIDVRKHNKSTFNFKVTLLDGKKKIETRDVARTIDYNSGYDDLKFFVGKS